METGCSETSAIWAMLNLKAGFWMRQVRYLGCKISGVLLPPWVSRVALKSPPANAEYGRDTGSIPVLGRSGAWNGTALLYSCLESRLDRDWPDTHTCVHTRAHAHTRTHLLMVVLVQCWGFIQGTLAWALRFWCWWRKKWFISIMGLLSGVCASPVALVVKNPPTKVGGVRDAGSVCGFRWFPRGGRGIPLQCSCLENPTDIGVWWDTAHSVTHNWTWLKWLSTSACMALFQMLGTHEFNTVNRDLWS